MGRILIAEDNRDIRALVERVLALDGHDVSTAGDGREAIEKIGNEHFDAILLDFMMPLATGFDVLEWIEENRPEVARSCVIIVTAAIHELQKFDSSKVFAAITKPFDVFALRDLVQSCIDGKPPRE